MHVCGNRTEIGKQKMYYDPNILLCIKLYSVADTLKEYNMYMITPM